MIIYLDKGSKTDIAYAVYQCARFRSEPRKSHADAIIHLCKYLQGIQEQGITINPKKDLQLEVYVDDYFIVNKKK